ncbi:MAG: hypothetical protein KDK51_02585, partial [Deltaproteobacteria bacterium]|nr:hypothetical protein [Deltaproteobacteria bacterium]
SNYYGRQKKIGNNIVRVWTTTNHQAVKYQLFDKKTWNVPIVISAPVPPSPISIATFFDYEIFINKSGDGIILWKVLLNGYPNQSGGVKKLYKVELKNFQVVKMPSSYLDTVNDSNTDLVNVKYAANSNNELIIVFKAKNLNDNITRIYKGEYINGIWEMDHLYYYPTSSSTNVSEVGEFVVDINGKGDIVIVWAQDYIGVGYKNLYAQIKKNGVWLNKETIKTASQQSGGQYNYSELQDTNINMVCEITEQQNVYVGYVAKDYIIISGSGNIDYDLEIAVWNKSSNSWDKEELLANKGTPIEPKAIYVHNNQKLTYLYERLDTLYQIQKNLVDNNWGSKIDLTNSFSGVQGLQASWIGGYDSYQCGIINSFWKVEGTNMSPKIYLSQHH